MYSTDEKGGDDVQYLTVEELAETLKISLSTAYTLVRSGRVRYIRVGAQYRIPVSALDELETSKS